MTDQEFIKAFENCKISKENWKHQDHIRMAWTYLRSTSSFDLALEKMRTGIQRLNLSHGNPTGYHETVTQVFAIYIWQAIKLAPSDETFDEFSVGNTWLYQSTNPFRKRHYTDELWNSESARAHFVPPDLEPLPRV